MRVAWAMAIVATALLVFVILWRPGWSLDRWWRDALPMTTDPTPTIKPVKPIKRVLVLDLDETLVHTEPFESSESSSSFHAKIHVRPGAVAFLERVDKEFDEVVLFTAGTKAYADAVVDTYLDPHGKIFSRRFYRDSCDPLTLAKDLRKLGDPLEWMLLVDNSPASYALQPRNGVPIRSYMGTPAEKNDDALAQLDLVARLPVRLPSEPPTHRP